MTESAGETTLNLQITTTDAALLKDLMEGAGDTEGASVAIGDSGSLTLTRHRRSRAWGQPEVINFALHIGTTLVVPIIASWISEKLKDRKAKLTLNDQTITSVTQQSLEFLIKQTTGMK
jgi:hypothetical protein